VRVNSTSNIGPIGGPTGAAYGNTTSSYWLALGLRLGLLYLPSERSEIGGYYVFTFVFLSMSVRCALIGGLNKNRPHDCTTTAQ